jgi:hypothetical protein
VSRAFGDYEFKGGRFDLLEDLKAGWRRLAVSKPVLESAYGVCNQRLKL